MIRNDVNPFGGQPKKHGTQRNRKDWITKNMVKMIQMESQRARTDYNEITADQNLRRHWVVWPMKFGFKKWGNIFLLCCVFRNQNELRFDIL